ncbi:MAG: non-canonical purine NTP diphosphatase [Bacteroidales bacterium]|nr:non-canonical purine NTP diphosphatase [Bacteroidales bacterium]
MKRIIFATNNAHKLEEVRHYLKDLYEVISLKEIGFNKDIPEPYETLEENALTKSKTIFERFGENCFADDTGLEVEALNGAPGVYSARYAGPNCSFEDNVKKLLGELEGKQNRKAKFRTVISLILDGKEYHFEGEVKGEISQSRSGDEGFGYDPIFIPDGYQTSFAEMSLDEKNKISHRGRAVAKLVEFLR